MLQREFNTNVGTDFEIGILGPYSKKAEYVLDDLANKGVVEVQEFPIRPKGKELQGFIIGYYRVYKLHDKSINIDIDEKIMGFIKGWAAKNTVDIVEYVWEKYKEYDIVEIVSEELRKLLKINVNDFS